MLRRRERSAETKERLDRKFIRIGAAREARFFLFDARILRKRTAFYVKIVNSTYQKFVQYSWRGRRGAEFVYPLFTVSYVAGAERPFERRDLRCLVRKRIMAPASKEKSCSKDGSEGEVLFGAAPSNK